MIQFQPMKKPFRHYALIWIVVGQLCLAQSAQDLKIQEPPKSSGTIPSTELSKSPATPMDEELVATFKFAASQQKAGNLENAANLYRQILEKRPHLAEVHNNLAMIYQAIGAQELARKEYEEAIRLVPDYGVALNNFAAMYFSSGEYYKARDMWARAAKGDPFNSEYCFNLALCYSKTGEAVLAIKLAKVAVKLNPQLAAAHYLLGQLAREQGNFAESLNAYERYVELTGGPPNPNSDEARRQIAEIKSFLGKAKSAAPSIQNPAELVPPAPAPKAVPKAQTGKKNGFVAALCRIVSPFKNLFSHSKPIDVATKHP